MPVMADPMNRLEEARKQIGLVAGAITDDQQHEDLMEARRLIDGVVDRQAGGDESSDGEGDTGRSSDDGAGSDPP